MNGSHIHLGVRDLAGALRWLDSVWDVRPTFQLPKMACVPFGGITLVLDAAENDTPATIAFKSADCHADFRRMVERGAEALKNPVDQPFGVRVGYLRGPGALTFEIEEAIPRTA